MSDDESMGSLMDQYCLATNISSSLLKLPRQFQFNYGQEYLEIQKESPLRIEGCERIQLEVHGSEIASGLESVITSRESRRRSSSEPLDVRSLAKLLYLGNGIRRVSSETSCHPGYRRNVPSAGNLGSTEIYCLALNVDGVKQGIYHFDSLSHELTRLHSGDFRTWLEQAVFLQDEASKAAAILVLACSLSKIAYKYQIRAYQLALMDAGHVSQNILLAATAMNLTTFPTAGFVNAELDGALGLDGLDRRSVLALCVSMPDGPEQMSI